MPPANYQTGLQNSLAKRSKDSRAFMEEAFGWITTMCLWEDANTLKRIAEELNAHGLRTKKGELWSPGTVQRVIKKIRGPKFTAKKLHDLMHAPSAYSKTKAEAEHDRWPQVVHSAYNAACNKLVEENGTWVSALIVAPKRAMRVQHGVHGEGQMVRKSSAAIFECSFVDWSDENFGTFSADCPANELEVWCYNLTPNQREAERARLKNYFYRGQMPD